MALDCCEFLWLARDRYSLHEKSETGGFYKAASSLVLDLGADESGESQGPKLITRWDRKNKRFVKVRVGEDPNDPRARRLRSQGGTQSKKSVYVPHTHTHTHTHAHVLADARSLAPSVLTIFVRA